MSRSALVMAACVTNPPAAPPRAIPEAARVLALVQAQCGGPRLVAPHRPDPCCAVLGWNQTGLMALTGPAGGPPLAPRAPVATRMSGLTDAVVAVTARWGQPVFLDLARVLAGRSAEAGWSRRGAMSANGSARLLATNDGWLAVNLARPSDFEVLPAVLGRPIGADEAWAAVTPWAAERSARDAANGLQEVGVPAATLGAHGTRSPVQLTRRGDPSGGSRRPPRVADLSALWAGPLVAHVLALAGSEVVTIEDVNRPDGARTGPPAFYSWLHAGHSRVEFDFTSAAGRAALADLVAGCDIVIEASRPRALRRLGLLAEDFLASRPGRTWLSITGYGRDAFDGNRVAFGDDAAVAGGLVAWNHRDEPVFCGDALADPLTGLWSAVAVIGSQLAGGGHLVDVAMSAVSADAARPVDAAMWHAHPVRRVRDHWTVAHEDGPPEPVLDPVMAAIT